ncbi:MAG: exosortase/archaeosortase family protein [Candidatus Omnitrophica bacterium]|nr:exosortase/archaeosortase family protein [Candidatus Omnitrophota bacterium]
MKKWISLGVMSLLLTFAYFPTIVWMVDRWSAKDSYFGHGFLIPFVSLYLVWRKRKEIATIVPSPSRWGLPLLITGLLVHLVSALIKVYFTSAFSILLTVTGLVLFLWGKKMLRAAAFPIIFLLFMVPFPLVVVGTATVRLKLFAAMCATHVLHAIGFPALQKGHLIYMKNAVVAVEDPCSGLRSLLSLLTLGVLFAYLKQASFPRKTLFFLSSIPIAMIANIVRIILLAGIADIYGVEAALKFFHDFSGFVVFGLALGGLSTVGRILR